MSFLRPGPLPSLNTGRHLSEMKKATKSIQKVKTFQVEWFHFQTAFSAKLRSAIYHQNYTVLPCLPPSLWVPLQPSQTDLVLHRRTVGVLRQISTRAINQVGRKEISAERQNMIAIKHPEEKTRALTCGSTAFQLDCEVLHAFQVGTRAGWRE